ncbi:MAG TPA: dephospho-CoA kinase [Demequinaceae bacterium]
MLRIGLTGGIASGKSVASERFAQLGARVIDHDDLARQAVQPESAALADIAREFGDRLITRGKLDRAALADIVFGDPEARAKVNAIVHPYIFALAKAADSQARLDGVKVIVHAIPLLVETGLRGSWDTVVTIAAPAGVRTARLVKERGLTAAQAESRLSAQVTDDERARWADIVLDGGGTVAELRKQVDRFWKDHVPVSAR